MDSLLKNKISIENLGVNISNAWIIGCSILTCGIITFAYLNGISDLQLLHMKRKYRLEQKQEYEKEKECNKQITIDDADNDLD